AGAGAEGCCQAGVCSGAGGAVTVLVGTGDGGAVTVLVGAGVTGVALAAGAARITDGLELLVSAPAAAAPPPSRNAAPVTAIAMVLRVHLMSRRSCWQQRPAHRRPAFRWRERPGRCRRRWRGCR